MPNKGDFGGFKKGFLLDQNKSSKSSEKQGQGPRDISRDMDRERQSSDRTDRSQSGRPQSSSDFGGFRRGFLLKDKPPQSQAPADQTQSPEAEASKGKGKLSDQERGLSRTGESSKQPERLSVFQLDELYKQSSQLSGEKLTRYQDTLPNHVRIQFGV